MHIGTHRRLVVFIDDEQNGSDVMGDGNKSTSKDCKLRPSSGDWAPLELNTGPGQSLRNNELLKTKPSLDGT